MHKNLWISWLVLLAAGPLFGAELFFSERDTGQISRARPDGSSVQEVLSGLDSPQKLYVDDVNRHLYWVESGARIVARSSLTGNDPVILVENLGGVTSVALDLPNGKLYWVSAWGNIGRANLDGSGEETLIAGLGAPQDLALDLTTGKMYWGNLNEGKLQRSNLDGTQIEDLATGVSPSGVTLDLAAQKIYWSDQNSDKIVWADIDGTNAVDLIFVTNPNGLAIDPEAGKLYWVDSLTLRRVDLDGSNPEILLTGLAVGRGVAFDFRDAVFADGFESGSINAWSNASFLSIPSGTDN